MDQHRIASTPDSIHYIPDFISAEEEAYILNKIPSNRWIQLAHRRLQAIPTTLSPTNTLLASPLPSWLTDPILHRFDNLALFHNAPHGVNHCLINEYTPGHGIMPHEDGPAYHPVVATVSLGGTIVLDISSKSDPSEKWRILQEPRSLLVTAGSAYTDTLHGIADVEVDEELGSESVANWGLVSEAGRRRIEADGGRSERSTRISLTYRDVKRVSSVGSKLFGKGRG